MRSSTESSEATPCQASTNRQTRPAASATRLMRERLQRARLDPGELRVRDRARRAAGRPSKLGDHPAGPRRQHHDAVGQEDGLLHVVGHEQDRARLLGQRGGEPLAQVRAGDRVERAEGLVEQQHRPALQQRAQEGDALAHPARQRGRAARARTRPGRSARTAAPRAARASARARRPGTRAPARRCRARRARAAAGRAGACRRRPRGGACADRHARRRAPAGRPSARAGSTCRSRRARPPPSPRRARSSSSMPARAVSAAEAPA